MRRWILVVLAMTGALGGFALATLKAAPDAPIPSTLAAWIEPARDIARLHVGLLAFAPIRLVDAGCTHDGRTAVLTFESAIGSTQTYATIGFPAAADLDVPGAVIVIGGSSRSEVAESLDEASCGLVPVGPAVTP